VSLDATITWRELWAQTTPLVGRSEARWLCEEACGAEGDAFLDELDQPATERMVAHLDAMLARLRAGEPLQYVLGHWPFRRLDLMVDRRVLIPRPETELVVETALGLVDRTRRVRCADLGCGSGAIGLSLAAELPVGGAEVWLTDVSSDALDVARANAAGLGRLAAAVNICEGSWWQALPEQLRGSLDLVVSNPPYIALGDPDVEAQVASSEPHLALFAGADGLDAVRVLVAGAGEWLAPGGALVVEIGAGQAAAIESLVAESDELVDADVQSDLAGRPRMLVARRAGIS
jgi:release factor glutamine methyltransferase